MNMAGRFSAILLQVMPVFRATYNHSAMRPEYRGCSIKHANSEKEALDLLGKQDKKLKIIIDKRSNVLSNIEIHEEKS